MSSTSFSNTMLRLIWDLFYILFLRNPYITWTLFWTYPPLFPSNFSKIPILCPPKSPFQIYVFSMCVLFSDPNECRSDATQMWCVWVWTLEYGWHLRGLISEEKNPAYSQKLSTVHNSFTKGGVYVSPFVLNYWLVWSCVGNYGNWELMGTTFLSCQKTLLRSSPPRWMITP